MQSIPLKSIGFLIAAGIVYGLQHFPYSGIFLMMLGAPFLTGLLLDLFFISLFFEAWRGRAPSWLMSVPVLAAGIYYGCYFQQMWDIHQKNAALLAENPKLVLRFNPAIHSLVDNALLVETYAVPVGYQPWGDNGEYRAHRLFPRERCDIRQDAQANIWMSYPATPNGRSRLCMLTMKEKPPGTLVEVTRTSNDPRRRQPESVENVEVRVGGVLKASFKTLHVRRLFPVPLFVAGCGLNDAAPSWDCFAQFMTSPLSLDGYGADKTYAEQARPEAVMLGLRRYNDDELNNYRGFAENEPMIAQAHGEADRVDRDLFETFTTLLSGEDIDMPTGTAFSISRDGEQLAPLAVGIAATFARLAGDPDDEAACIHRNASLSSGDCRRDSAKHPARGNQLAVLATALAAIPPDAYRPIALSVFHTMQHAGMAREHPLLYVRSADAGTAALPFFMAAFRASEPFRPNSMLAVLGLCRIGQADTDTIAEMKRRFLSEGDGNAGRNDYRGALALALIKLGQKPFVEANKAIIDRHGGADIWLAKVLADTGTTATGPNNCMSQRWEFGDVMTPVMAPTVTRRRL